MTQTFTKTVLAVSLMLAFAQICFAGESCMTTAERGTVIFNKLRAALSLEVPFIKFRDDPHSPGFKKWNSFDLKFAREYDDSLNDFPILAAQRCKDPGLGDAVNQLVSARSLLGNAHDALLSGAESSGDLLQAFDEFLEAEKTICARSRNMGRACF